MSPQPYPHLLPAEGLIWDAWLQGHAAAFDRFDYDIRVGKGHPTLPEHPAYIKRMIQALSPKRIDVVGWKDKVPTIFEVSPRGGRTVVGALFLYRWLWVQQFGPEPPPRLAGVAPRWDPDVRAFLEAQNVALYVVPAVVAL